MSLLPLADGYADTTAGIPQTSSNSGPEAGGTGGNQPSEEGQALPNVDNERVTTSPWAFGSPAWCFFGVPGGSSNIQRELVVTCMLCRAKVRRGINPGKVGTTCLFTHLERRHSMTRQEVYEQAVASGYCGPNTTSAALSSESGGVGSGSRHARAPSKRPGVFPSSSDDEDEKPKRPATTAPATSSGPSTTSSFQSDKPSQIGAGSAAYCQALRERLLGSVHMFCEVCHALVLSGERSQNVRDLALETHFSTNHPQMFKLLKSGAARDVRLGGLGPLSALPSGSLPSSVQR
ncbi:cytoplasmic tRNA 2-thiolation protein 1 isoform X2 [Rhinoderma darwinii]|uniref:cytoplasmic tRNA 2-thiolation protein 1 isoform X2 n=1 Tax=Rhinoderma darwinii TaxID=43563 RepID=UPI003F673D17